MCSRCRVAPTRCWLQLIGLITLAVAAMSDSFAFLILFPRLVTRQNHWVFHAWLWMNHVLSSFGWAVVAVGLLVWSLWGRRGYKIQAMEWLARPVLVLTLVGGLIFPLLPQIHGRYASAIRFVSHNRPGFGPTMGWGLIAVVLTSLCMNSEIRDSLLGHGRVLSLISLGVLILVTAMTLVGWSIGY